MKFYLIEKIAFTSTRVKKAPASSSHTCWKNVSCQPQGKVGKMKQVLNKSLTGNFPPAFVALASTEALKMPSQSDIKRATVEWSCVSSLYVLEIKPFSEVSLANTFSHMGGSLGRQKIQLKMGKGLEQTLLQGGHTEGPKSQEKVFNITGHKREAN